MKPSDIGDLMKLAREHGATHVRVGEVEFTLGRPPAGETAAPRLPETLAPTCKCGHPKYDHRADGCIHGCNPKRCLPTGKAPAKE